MCIGVSRAEPRTHSTIVATLVLPASGTGPLLVPTAFQTATSTGTGVRTTTTSPTATVNLPTGTELTSTTATPTSVASPTFTFPPTATTDPEAASEGQPQLTSAQIAGIILGCSAVVIFGILLVLLARCIRKRRFGDLESGFSRMRDSMSFGKRSRPSSAPGPLQISSPLPRVQAERNPADPRWQPQIPRGAVGLAISPLVARGGVFAKPPPALASVLPAPHPLTASEGLAPAAASTSTPAPQRLPQFILSPPPERRAATATQSPPKPALTLAIPKGQKPVVRVPANARDSVVTEFAEDGEGEGASGSAIWRPPATDPLSATAVYFADKGGNWILRSAPSRKPGTEPFRGASGPATQRPVIQEVAAAPVEVELPSPDHKTKAERAKDAYGGFSPDAVVSPLRLPQKSGQTRLGSPIAFQDRRREPQFSSPSLSARLSQTAETLGKQSTPANQQSSDPYFGMVRETRDLTGGKGRRRSVKRASRRMSQGSATSIESAEDEDVIEDEAQVDLSPVAESPHTPISPGKSPVTYPKIRKRDGGEQMPPPHKAAEADLLPPAHRYNVWHPPGHSSSPTGSGSMSRTRTAPLGASNQASAPRKAWNAPPLKPASNRNPSQPTASLQAHSKLVSPTDSQYRQQQQQRHAANPAAYWNQSQKPQGGRVRPPPPTPPHDLPGENTPSRRHYETPPLQQQQQQQQQRRPTRATEMNPSMLPTPAATPQQQPAPTAASDTSSQGSLLAKRRGAEKAAALTLVGNGNRGSRKGHQGENERMGGGSRNGKNASGAGGWTRETATAASSYYDGSPMPITPGWMPELTPTRRGEDLYLNVR